MSTRYGEITTEAMWITGTRNRVDNAVLGIAGEAGEIADLFKKIKFHPGTKKTLADVRGELGDLLFYLAALNNLLFGDSLKDVAVDNLKKLQARHPESTAYSFDPTTLTL